MKSLDLVRPHIGFISSEFQARYDRELQRHRSCCIRTYAERSASMIHFLTKSVCLQRIQIKRLESCIPAGRQFGVMSYGEQRKMLIARALVFKAGYLLSR